MTVLSVEAGKAVNLTATADVTTANCKMLGFYVNSTTAGTIVFRRGGSGGTAISGTITPAIGFHGFPADCPSGCHATIGATLNVTVFVVEGIG